jgi:hypothetical protein
MTATIEVANLMGMSPIFLTEAAEALCMPYVSGPRTAMFINCIRLIQSEADMC